MLDQLSLKLCDVHLLFDLDDFIVIGLLWIIMLLRASTDSHGLSNSSTRLIVLSCELEKSLRGQLYRHALPLLCCENTLLDDLLEDADLVLFGNC